MAGQRSAEPDQDGRPDVIAVSHGLGWPELRSGRRRARVGWPEDGKDFDETSEAEDDG